MIDKDYLDELAVKKMLEIRLNNCELNTIQKKDKN